MQLESGRVLVSPSDLSGFLACPHLTQLELSVARGERRRPVFDDPQREMLLEKGRQHEAKHLAELEAKGLRVVRIPTLGSQGFEAEEARRRTEETIRAAEADVIHQPYLTDGVWRGFADFLVRGPDGAYEPVDTKLARASRPEHVLQLCYYAEQIERVQGRLPERMHVELGSGQRESFRTEDFMAYYRRARSRFLEALERSEPTYPWRCDRCPICVWRRECHTRLEADNSVALVAGLRRSDAERLIEHGWPTLTQLGSAPPGVSVDGFRPPRLESLRRQAGLQLHHLRTGEHRFELMPDEPERGFHLLPEPSPGDIWLDLEGHPFFEPARGLEYLFGWCWRDDDGVVRYEARWAYDRAGEKRAFEEFVRWAVERRRRFPGAHIYHYANYERSALLRLMGEHCVCEDEIDDLLRADALVDLYQVTRQALRASVERYSIKNIEALYGFVRQGEVRGGAESTVLFEDWLELGDPSLLEAIERYNEDDCRSTALLHDWLLAIRPAGLPWRQAPELKEASEAAKAEGEERDLVKAALLARSAAEGDTPWLVAQLLDYHRREAKPEWWAWFLHRKLDEEELIRNRRTLGGLEPMGEPPVPDKRSLVYRLSFPPQDHKIDGTCEDQEGNTYKVKADDERGLLTLRRGANRSEEPLPRGLMPSGPPNDQKKRAAVLRFALSYLAGDGSYPALVDVLERRPPRVDLGLPVPEAALTIDRSYLFVQGPPGAGKTWQGAKAAVSLMRAGRRVGVTALSHKAIHKLLEEIEAEAARQRFLFRGRKKHSDEDDAYSGLFIESTDELEDLLDPGLLLVAGTSWLFAAPEMEAHVDTLFIDEAGQFSLADAVVCGTAARNLILLGDPNQLPQVSQGAQPKQARVSVLQHLLGAEATVPQGMGIFLRETWRLRPELCSFTSSAYYEGRLSTARVCERRDLSAGNGLVVLPVEHEGCRQSSREEARAIAAAIHELLGATFTDEDGTARRVTEADVLVVAPYNAQVRALRGLLPEGVRIGTVDKFQGQEAPIVFVSFASSSGADAPRGITFAFDRHRVNVATSRAQCRSTVVCSPRLLEAECQTIEQMRLMNAVCRFVEMSEAGAAPPPEKPRGGHPPAAATLDLFPDLA